MTKTIIAWLAVVVIISSGGVVWAAQTNYDIGKVGASELKLGLGARPVAMGEAYVALADDLNALAWNPAGLAQMQGYQAGFMHNIYLEETSQEYLAYAQNLFAGAGIGANVTYLNYGAIDKTGFDEATGMPVDQGQFTPYVMTASAGYGQWLLENLAVGGAVKVFTQNIDTETYSAVAVDVGGLLKPGIDGLQIGLAVQNLGTKVADAYLPMNAKAGAAYVLPALVSSRDIWNVALDVNLPFGDVNYTSVNVGTEYWYDQLVAGRVGYKIKDTGEMGGIAGLTAGIGFKLDIFNVDYALGSYGDLGLIHQVAVAVRF
ncbi:MAG: PorV/PorQ family protein [candidate division FCPU426 bacterium]